jgi:hypothetical protein
MSRFVWAGRVAASLRTVVACARGSLSAVERVCKVKVAEDGCGVVVELGGVMGKAMEEGATRQNKRERHLALVTSQQAAAPRQDPCRA